MSAQYSRAERLAIETLKARIADPQETDTAKTRARNELQRIRESAVARMKAKHAKSASGSDVQAPKREHFASDAEFEAARELYRERLDEISCHKKLDSPRTGFYGRRAAEKKLQQICEARLKRGQSLIRSAPAVRVDAPAVNAFVAAPKIEARKKEGGLSPEVIKQFEENLRMMKSNPEPPKPVKPEPSKPRVDLVELPEPKPASPSLPRLVTYPTASGGSIEVWEYPPE